MNIYRITLYGIDYYRTAKTTGGAKIKLSKQLHGKYKTTKGEPYPDHMLRKHMRVERVD
jgi:hypothetical protein